MASNDSRSIGPPPAHPDDLQFLRVADVCALLRISRPTLWRLRRANEFPAPTCLSRRSIGWLRNDVASWARTRAEPALVADVPTIDVSPSATPAATTRQPSGSTQRALRRKRRQLALGLQPPL